MYAQSLIRCLARTVCRYSTTVETPHQQSLRSRGLPTKQSIPGVDKILLVASGKGGVGIDRVRDEIATSTPRHRILLGCSGSCASLDVPELARELIARDMSVAIVPTQNSLHFFSTDSIEGAMVFTDADEWSMWQGRGDPVLHIDLRNWATMMLVAPLGTNMMGKIANGLADNLLTCVARAWPVGEKPFLFAPAMNTDMYNHPITREHLHKLNQFGYVCIDPIEGKQMSGRIGFGCLALVETIVKTVERHNGTW